MAGVVDTPARVADILLTRHAALRKGFDDTCSALVRATMTADLTLDRSLRGRFYTWLERGFASKGFRGCPFVNAVAELGSEDRSVKKIAIAFKESRRLWFRDLLRRLDVADAEGLATQLTLLVDGSIAQDLVRDDPSMARAAKAAAKVLLANAGVEIDG